MFNMRDIQKESFIPGSESWLYRFENLIISLFSNIPSRKDHHFSKRRTTELFLFKFEHFRNRANSPLNLKIRPYVHTKIAFKEKVRPIFQNMCWAENTVMTT
jgi:hypothetical protein